MSKPSNSIQPRGLSSRPRIPVGETAELHGWDAERAWAAAHGVAALPYALWEQAIAQCAVLWAGLARRALQ